MAKIFLTGYMGSGKSTAGKKLAAKLGFEFVDLDKFVESECGETITEIFDKKGENEFRALEHNALKKLLSKDDLVVACGGGTPCYYGNMDLMNNNGTTIYLKMSAESLASRLVNSKGKRPLLENKNEQELREYITEHLEKREDIYHQAHYIVKGKNLDIDELVEFVSAVK
ncbi:MAG: shikimate kinase [Bacteroidota bacterium]|jgi:shikimate kinase|nr:shikimate kinase [Bacteroidota bacterium]